MEEQQVDMSDSSEATRLGPLRARLPEQSDFVLRDGVRIHYEVFGSGEPTILLLPTWSVVHAAHGRFQYADLSRHYRVVTFDGRGNGRSDRPQGALAYAGREFVADAIAVLDATATERAVVIGCSSATHWLLALAADHPDRVTGAVASGTNLPLAPGYPMPADMVPFHEPYRSTEGWAKFNADYWREDYQGFLRYFFSQVWTEPHSQKLIDDCVAWGLETTPATLIDTVGANAMTEAEALELIGRVRCPMLVVHGGEDAVTPPERSIRLAEAAGASLVILDGAGHCSGNRDPVKFNLLVREFVGSIAPRGPRTVRWARSHARSRRVLFVPSGSGLRTVRRDLAMADALRALRPGVRVDWLVGSPVRDVLKESGEQVHPASDALADEAGQLEQAGGGQHELHRFAASRRMDEALFANFMIFNDVITDEHADLVLADSAWQIDHYLHENPELKRFAYAWLTDSVGWLPIPEGGEPEAQATADANAQMVEQVERFRRIRDRALYLGDPADLPRGRFGPGLAPIREWAREHFSFAGPVMGFDRSEVADRQRLRTALGYASDDQICVVTAGGTALGEGLLRRSIEAFPIAQRRLPRLRMVVVAGPRVDPSTFPRLPGIEVHGNRPRLYRYLAACDVAVVHGGLSTTMELVATGRPFLWFPFRYDFEQRYHVAQRLARHGAGRPMEYADTTPEELAEAILEQIGREVRYRPVSGGGAARAAALLAPLI